MENLNAAFSESIANRITKAQIARHCASVERGDISQKSVEVQLSKFVNQGLEIRTRTFEELTEALPPEIEADVILRSIRESTKQALSRILVADYLGSLSDDEQAVDDLLLLIADAIRRGLAKKNRVSKDTLKRSDRKMITV